MPDLFAKLAQEWPVITGAPIISISAAAAVAAVIWTILHWSFKSRLESRDAEIALISRQRDHFKDQLLGGAHSFPPPLTAPIASNDGRGGKGGSGTINGDKGTVFGGRGGDGGSPDSGRGGDGGGGTITGDSGVIRGGQGGSAGGYDGRGGKATAPLPSLVNLPKEAWGAGRGGSGANAPEYSRRVSLLIEARQDYMEAFPDTCPYIMAGIDQVSPDWINARLESIGETWRVQPGDEGYVLPPLTVVSGAERFDPTTNDGLLTIGAGELRFVIHFYKQDAECIGVSKSGTNLKAIARVKNVKKGDPVFMSKQDSTSQDYAINSGEYFIAKNHTGHFMIARIDAVEFEGRAGADRDEVRFTYELDPSGKPHLTAI